MALKPHPHKHFPSQLDCLPSLLFSFNLRKECDEKNFYLHHHYSAFPRCVCQEFEFHVWFKRANV